MDTECSEFDRKLDTVESTRFHHEEAEEINRSMDLSLAFWGRMDDVSGVIPATKLKCFMKKPSRASEIAAQVWKKITESHVKELKYTEMIIMKDGEISAEKLFQVLQRVVEGVGIHLDEVLNDDEVPVTETAIRIMNELLYMYNHNEPLQIVEEQDGFMSSFYYVMEPKGVNERREEQVEDLQEIRFRIDQLLQQARDLDLGEINMPSSSLSERSRLMIVEEQVRAKIRIKGIHRALKEQKERRINTADLGTGHKNRLGGKGKAKAVAARKEGRKNKKLESSTTQCRPVFKSAVKPREIEYNSLIRNVPDLQNRLRRVNKIKKQMFDEKLKAIDNRKNEPYPFDYKNSSYKDGRTNNQYFKPSNPYKYNSTDNTTDRSIYVNTTQQNTNMFVAYDAEDECEACDNEVIVKTSEEKDVGLLTNSDQGYEESESEQTAPVYMTEEYEEENISLDKACGKGDTDKTEKLTENNGNWVYLDSAPTEHESGELNSERNVCDKEERSGEGFKDGSNIPGLRPISREEMLTEMKKIVKEALQEMTVSPNPTIWSQQEVESRKSMSEESAVQNKYPSRPSTSKNEEETSSSDVEESITKLSSYNCCCDEMKVGIERVVKSDMEIVDIKVTQENVPQLGISNKGEQERKSVSTEISVSSVGTRSAVKVSVVSNKRDAEECPARDTQQGEVQEALALLKTFLQTNVQETPPVTDHKTVEPVSENTGYGAKSQKDEFDEKEELVVARLDDPMLQEDDSLQRAMDPREELVLPTISVNLAMMLEECAYTPTAEEMRGCGAFHVGDVLVGEHVQTPVELIGDGLQEYRYPEAWANWQNQVWMENFSRNSLDNDSLFVNGSSDVLDTEHVTPAQGPMTLPHLQNSSINDVTVPLVSQSPIRTVMTAFGRVVSGIVNFATFPITFSYGIMNNSFRWVLRKNRPPSVTE